LFSDQGMGAMRQALADTHLLKQFVALAFDTQDPEPSKDTPISRVTPQE